ncbi:MAG: transposase [Deltaproteobacteria bacterium]|nr:transposase [Deltaproteobacteria bacterium]
MSSLFSTEDQRSSIAYKTRMLRNSRRRTRVVKDLKLIYRVTTVGDVRVGLKEFKAKWDGKYPDVVRMWEKDFERITSFCLYPFELRRLNNHYECSRV